MLPDLFGRCTRSLTGVDAVLCLVVKTGHTDIVKTGETAVVLNRR